MNLAAVRSYIFKKCKYCLWIYIHIELYTKFRLKYMKKTWSLFHFNKTHPLLVESDLW